MKNEFSGLIVEEERRLRAAEIKREKLYFINYESTKKARVIKIGLTIVGMIMVCIYLALYNSTFTYTLNTDGSATITECYSTAFVVKFPSQIDGYAVTKVSLNNAGSSFNKKCPFAVKVVISEGTKEIGSTSFSDANIRYLELPSTIAAINYKAFSNCENLKQIEMNKGDYISTEDTASGVIGAYAFGGCISLESIYLNNNIYKIGENAFNGCTSLRVAELSESIRNIEKNAFRYCENLVLVKMPQSMEILGVGAFYGCKMLTEISIPSGVKRIDNYCFAQCRVLNNVQISETVEEIGEFAFANCNALSYIYIPGNVVNINGFAFKDMSSLIAGNTVIITPEGSAGEEYAKKYNMTYQN